MEGLLYQNLRHKQEAISGKAQFPYLVIEWRVDTLLSSDSVNKSHFYEISE
jgi:hypothetical protein